MKKLKLKDINNYVPYKLNIARNDDVVEIKHVGAIKTLTFLTVRDTSMYSIDGWKPVLRPVSDLHKKITHNGEEFVPILKLAKLSHPNYAMLNLRNELNFAAWEDWDGIEHTFMYNHVTYAFFTVVNCNEDYDEYVETRNQMQLFDYLNELKIDYRGLIDAGLAIDANTLKENPYK
jgi:hypothetical protein